MLNRTESRFLFRLSGMILVLFLSFSCTYAGEADSSQEDDFIAWAAERAVRFETLDWRDADINGLSVLDEALAGKRFIYLGESDHFMDEKNDFRMILIRYLVSKGFRNIGMEMGMSDARRMDLYLATGDESHLDRIAIYGYEGGRREDRNDDVEGSTRQLRPVERNRRDLFCERSS